MTDQPTQPLTGQPMRPTSGCSIAGPNGSRIPVEEPHAYSSHKGANTIFVRTCDLCGAIDWDALHEATVERVAAEVSRLRAENTALREARDGVCSRCRFPVWSHDLWKCVPWDMGEYVGDDELRREVVLRELNQGALAGMSSEVTDQAADLVLAALNRYDAWRAEPDPRALGLDQDGEGQANG